MSIDVRYLAFNPSKADMAWKELLTSEPADWNLGPTEWAKELSEELANYIEEDISVYRPAILNYLAEADLEIGSEVPAVTLREPRWSPDLLDFLFRTFVPDQFSKFSKEFWESLPTQLYIELFQRLSREKLQEALLNISEKQLVEYNVSMWDKSHFANAVVEFAYQIRPIVVACKQSEGKIVMDFNSEVSDRELLKRASRHLDALVKAYPDLKERLTDKL